MIIAIEMQGDKIINFRDINKATDVNRKERFDQSNFAIKNIFANKEKAAAKPNESFAGKLEPNRISKLDLSKAFFNNNNPLDTEVL